MNFKNSPKPKIDSAPAKNQDEEEEKSVDIPELNKAPQENVEEANLEEFKDNQVPFTERPTIQSAIEERIGTIARTELIAQLLASNTQVTEDLQAILKICDVADLMK